MAERLTPPLFAILSSLVGERLGLHYADKDADVFADKVMARAREAGFESALDYYYFLRYDPAAGGELDRLVDSLVVCETFFFREINGLRAGITSAVLPAIERRGRARIWSAACATGEEPLSLAMLLSAQGVLDRCSIVATDLSQRALDRARSGVHTARALRALDGPMCDPEVPALAERHLRREGNTVLADTALTTSIDFRRVNLVDTAAVRALGRFDLILCRNVLIYFSEGTTRDVVVALSDALERDGKILVGASESLLRFGTGLECEEHRGAFVYGRNT